MNFYWMCHNIVLICLGTAAGSRVIVAEPFYQEEIYVVQDSLGAMLNYLPPKALNQPWPVRVKN